jgi:hypothetical protein
MQSGSLSVGWSNLSANKREHSHSEGFGRVLVVSETETPPLATVRESGRPATALCQFAAGDVRLRGARPSYGK